MVTGLKLESVSADGALTELCCEALVGGLISDEGALASSSRDRGGSSERELMRLATVGERLAGGLLGVGLRGGVDTGAGLSMKAPRMGSYRWPLVVGLASWVVGGGFGP